MNGPASCWTRWAGDSAGVEGVLAATEALPEAGGHVVAGSSFRATTRRRGQAAPRAGRSGQPRYSAGPGGPFRQGGACLAKAHPGRVVIPAMVVTCLTRVWRDSGTWTVGTARAKKNLGGDHRHEHGTHALMALRRRLWTLGPASPTIASRPPPQERSNSRRRLAVASGSLVASCCAQGSRSTGHLGGPRRRARHPGSQADASRQLARSTSTPSSSSSAVSRARVAFGQYRCET